MSMDKKWICENCGYEINEQIKTYCPSCKQKKLQAWGRCQCGKWFRLNNIKSSKYCSRECTYKFRNTGGKRGKHYPNVRPWNKRDEVSKICPVCGAVFLTRKEKAVYCSKECWSRRSTIIQTCLKCGREFKTTKSSNYKYCSTECRNLASRERTGEKAWAWKGGKTKETKCRRTSAHYKEWRMAVFTRDGFKCQICGKHGSDLEAHHIKEVCNYPDLIFEVDNGLTLCHKCHKTTDNYAHKAKRHDKGKNTAV